MVLGLVLVAVVHRAGDPAGWSTSTRRGRHRAAPVRPGQRRAGGEELRCPCC